MKDTEDIDSIYFSSLNCNGFERILTDFLQAIFKGDDRQIFFYCYNDPLFPPKKTA